MNIPVTIGKEEIRLTADDKNFEIRKLRITKDKAGKNVEEWFPVMYFPTLEGALNRILSLKVAASAATSLKELKADLDRARKEINALWKTALT